MMPPDLCHRIHHIIMVCTTAAAIILNINIIIILFKIRTETRYKIQNIAQLYLGISRILRIAIIMIPSIKYSNIIKRENNLKIYFNVNVLKRTKINIYFVIIFRFLIISVGSARTGNY